MHTDTQKRERTTHLETIECRNPGTLERLGDVPIFDARAVGERVARARAAQVSWGQTSFAERRRVLRALLDHIVDHQEEICRACSRDSGKTLVDAAMGEVFPVCEKIRYLIANGERDLAPEKRASGILMHKAARVEYQPLGVAGVICPWNFPFHNILCPVVPALFAGNAVIAKASEWTSWSASDFQAIFDEVLRKTGHSTDLVQIITGAGETGAALVGSVDKVFFTGSPENGKRVMVKAAETLTPVVLELGGKDPMIVCDDADLSQAVAAAMLGVYTACGQMCVAAERIYVHHAIYDRFVDEVVRRAGALRQGPPTTDEGGAFDVGAMTMPRQLEIIERQIADAVAKGAQVRTGGHRNPRFAGQFFEPTVLTHVDHSMAVMREETFGPVMTIARVHDDEEAIRLANDCAYGLGSSVFSKDARRADRIARRISAGMTVVNDYGIAYMVQSAPFGGIRISGFGRINGREGLRGCCNVKTIISDKLPLRAAFTPYPVKAQTFPLFADVVSLLYGSGVTRKARAAASAAKKSLVDDSGRQLMEKHQPKREAAAAPSPSTIPCHDPATLQSLGEVPVVAPAEVRDRVRRALRAQQSWGRTSFAERRRVLGMLLDQILDETDELVEMICRDAGKTRENALLGEIWPICEKLRHTIATGERDLAPETVSPGLPAHKRATIEFHPMGVIGVICPWNFPLQNVLGPVIPALMAGNAVVVKVSEWTSWSAPRIQELFDVVLRKAGQSTDLVQVITGYGETGAALCNAGVGLIVFTGSMPNGRRVAKQCAETLTPVILELGGKDPMIVCDDAELEQAVHAAMAGVFIASGQMCLAAERIYVQEGIYDRFVDEVVRLASSLRQGAPLTGEVVDIGAMTMPAQLDVIERLVDDAVAKGATLRVGGKRLKGAGGQFFPPTVLTGVDHTMAIMREETFGPVMAIAKVRSDDEALRLANDTEYGLGSSVFTKSRARARFFTDGIVAGSTIVNDFGLAYMANHLPFGGVRGSGFGRLNGRSGIRACCHVKSVLDDRFPLHQPLKLFPIGDGNYARDKSVIGMLYRRGVVGRAKVAWSAVQRLFGR